MKTEGTDSSFRVEISFFVDHYHKLPHMVGDAQSSWGIPDLFVCFHPGFWGYDSWSDTIKLILKLNRWD